MKGKWKLCYLCIEDEEDYIRENEKCNGWICAEQVTDNIQDGDLSERIKKTSFC